VSDGETGNIVVTILARELPPGARRLVDRRRK
jgi:hypothetical protein